MSEEVNTHTKQETSEVILPPGSGESTLPALSSMFDRIQEAKEEGRSAKEVIAEKPEPEEKAEKAEKAEKKPEPLKEEPKEESDLSKKLNDTQQKKEDKKQEDEEVSREKLRAATEEKKEDAKPEKPAEDDVPEDELKVLPADKPKTAKRIQALLRRIDSVNSEVTKTKAEAKEKADRLAELEKKLSETKPVDPATDAKVKEQLDELAMYRLRVESAEKTIIQTLTNRQAGEGLIKAIKDEGGWLKFSSSSRVYPLPDGETVTGAELADRVLAALPLGERKAIESAMVEQVATEREKDRYFKDETSKATDYFKKKEEESQQLTTQQAKAMEDARKQLAEYEKKLLDSEWLKDKPIDPKATPAEKAAAEEHNKYNAQLRALAKKSFQTADLAGIMDMVQDSVRYYDERRTSNSLKVENAKLKAELATKQAEIDKFKVGGRSVPRAGSIASPSSDAPNRPQAPVGIGAAFDAIERGERVSSRRGGDDE
jgi:hypothetical protein